jgi:hypothetical protein
MKTILVEIKDSKVYNLLKDLDELNLIRIKECTSKGKKRSDKYAGKLTKEVASELQNYVSESRDEWEKRDI